MVAAWIWQTIERHVMDTRISNHPTYVMFLILAPPMYPSSLCVVVVPQVSKVG